jgi:hypothetical protein
VPGHSGVEGNEAADEGAKDAALGKVSHTSRLPDMLSGGGPLPSSVSAMKQKYAERLNRKWKRNWEKSPRHRRISAIDSSLPSKKNTKYLLSLNRKQTSIITQLRTGHIALNAYLFKIKKSDTDICQNCRDGPETVHHYLFDCTAYGQARHKRYLALRRDSDSLTFLLNDPKGIKELSIYVNRTRRFKNIFGEIIIPKDQKRQ